MPRKITGCSLRRTSLLPPPEGGAVIPAVCITLLDEETPVKEFTLTYEEFRKFVDDLDDCMEKLLLHPHGWQE